MVFQPGQSGCPGGNGMRRREWKEALQRALRRRQVLLIGEQGSLLPSVNTPGYDNHNARGSKMIIPPEQALEVIADLTVQQALCGDKDARSEIGNRLDGKPPQTLEGGDFPLVTAVRWLDDEDHVVVDVEVDHVNGNGAMIMLGDPETEPPTPEPTPTPEPEPEPADPDNAEVEGDEVQEPQRETDVAPLRVEDLDGDDVLGDETCLPVT